MCLRRQHPCQAHLTVAVVEYTTPFKRQKRGLCSSYLAACTPVFPEAGSPQAEGPGQQAPLPDGQPQPDADAWQGQLQQGSPVHTNTGGGLEGTGAGVQAPGSSSTSSNGVHHEACSAPAVPAAGACCLKNPSAPAPAERVAVWVEKGSLRVPPLHVPLILIGPGTGESQMFGDAEREGVALGSTG